MLLHTLTDIFTYIIGGIDRNITNVSCLGGMPRPCSLNGKFSLSSSRLRVCLCAQNSIQIKLPMNSDELVHKEMRLFLREMNERDMNTVLQPTQTHRERSPSLQQWHNFPGPKSTLPSSLQGRTHHTLQWSVKNGQNPRALSVCLSSQSGPTVVLDHVSKFNDKFSFLVFLTRFKSMLLKM